MVSRNRQQIRPPKEEKPSWWSWVAVALVMLVVALGIWAIATGKRSKCTRLLPTHSRGEYCLDPEEGPTVISTP